MRLSYGVRSLEVPADQYESLREVLNDVNIQVGLGRPENVDVVLNGEVVTSTDRRVSETDRIEFVTKANKKGGKCKKGKKSRK